MNFYANDREIKRLEIDVDARVSAGVRASLVACCANVPCCASGVCCLPNLAYSLLCYKFYEAKVAAAHRLILREKSLLFEVDPYYQPCVHEKVGVEYWPTTVCFFGCGGGPCDACGRYVAPKPLVIPLADLREIQVMKGPSNNCGCTIAPEHLVVTGSSNAPENNLWGGIGLSIQGDEMSVAGPKNADEFIEAVLSQKQTVLAQGPGAGPKAPRPKGMMEQLGAAAAALGMHAGGAAPPPPQQMQRAEEVQEAVVATPVEGGGDVTEKLEKLVKMKENGLLTHEQFELAKGKLLNSV